MDPTGADGGGMGGGIGVTGGGMMNREQIKKMSEADKEMELRANRAKALLAERHIGLKENQVCIFETNRPTTLWWLAEVVVLLLGCGSRIAYFQCVDLTAYLCLCHNMSFQCNWRRQHVTSEGCSSKLK